MNVFDKLSLTKVLNDFDKLKKNISEWVISLDTKQYDLEKRMLELEQKIRRLETLRQR